jgi:hypothetical protein
MPHFYLHHHPLEKILDYFYLHCPLLDKI